MFNVAPIINLAPGSQADLSKVIAHYERENQETEKARVARTQV